MGPMTRIISPDNPSTNSTVSASLISPSTLFPASPDEGLRLVRAFLRIENLERRRAAVSFVEDLARTSAPD